MRLPARWILLSAAALVVACSSDEDDDPMMPPLDDPDPSNPSVFEVQGSADFTIRHDGAFHYLFSWTDPSGTYTDVPDPTLVLEVGETYTFTRVTEAHPFRITTGALPVSGSDGSFLRTTTSTPEIESFSMTPLEDFTSDPAPANDAILWTPTSGDVGDYYYTCLVVAHTGMTGAIRVR